MISNTILKLLHQIGFCNDLWSHGLYHIILSIIFQCVISCYFLVITLFFNEIANKINLIFIFWLYGVIKKYLIGLVVFTQLCNIIGKFFYFHVLQISLWMFYNHFFIINESTDYYSMYPRSLKKIDKEIRDL